MRNTVEWRTIPSFPNYAVSNYGKVKRLTPGPRTQPGKMLALQGTDAMLFQHGRLHRRNVTQLAIEAFASRS